MDLRASTGVELAGSVQRMVDVGLGAVRSKFEGRLQDLARNRLEIMSEYTGTSACI